MKNEIVIGSIADLAAKNNQSIAETFMSCDCVILIDVSGSMRDQDNTRVSRYDRACKALRDLQGSMQGKIAVVSFANEPLFVPSGVPAEPAGGTELGKALKFIHPADQIPDMRFILISDGCPNDPNEALKIAKTFKNRIDVIFVGNELESGAIDFLNALARNSGGKQITADSLKIAETTRLLLSN